MEPQTIYTEARGLLFGEVLPICPHGYSITCIFAYRGAKVQSNIGASLIWHAYSSLQSNLLPILDRIWYDKAQ